MTDTRAKFRQLTRVFDTLYRPYQDAADGPGSSYVAEAHEGYRKQLDGALDLNDNAKLLVAGQSGCGKTTLLLSVAHRLRSEGRIVAFVNLEAHTSVQDLGAVEMHLAAATELLVEAKNAGVPITGETLAACSTWLGAILGSAPTAEPDALAAALRRQLEVVREDRVLRDELRKVVKRDPAMDPVELVGRILGDLTDRRPVVILDGLDKLSPENARDTFLDDKTKPMVGAPGAAILTIPLSIVYEPEFGQLAERYLNADSAVLPAVRIWEYEPVSRKRVRSEKGIEVLRRIVEARIAPIDPGIIMPDAVERVGLGSAGNIRELARLVQASIIKALVREGDVIEPRDIEAAIADRRESFRRGYEARFLPILKKVREEHQLDDATEAREVCKLLLYGLWVIEYRNGNTWYSLPEPVEQLVWHLENRPR
jgi:energy-coupling factor transporter ATP-binding protein EcfA2